MKKSWSKKELEQNLINILRHRKREAKRTLLDFILYTFPEYELNNHHVWMCNRIQKFIDDPNDSRLMIFCPPQHGKSEIVSRRLPAFMIGREPDRSILITSYAADLANSFNRDVKRIIEDEKYKAIFPEITLPSSKGKGIDGKSYQNTQNLFEIPGYRGFIKSVGVGGPITGNPVKLGIIDDPIKGAEEANSQTYREKLWEWYSTVFDSRLHEDSKVLITLTRWHQDDLAGRLIKNEGLKSDGGLWDVFSLPAIKENNKNPIDTREIGSALWPSRRSRKTLERIKKLYPTTFASLYQQRPKIEGGNIIKQEWFNRYDPSELPAHVPVRFTLDPAYTEKDENDPSGICAYAIHEGRIYLLEVTGVRMAMPDLVKFIPEFIARNRRVDAGLMRVEPKASGKSIVQMLEREGLPIVEAKSPASDKIARLNAQLPHWESGKVCIPNSGYWVDDFINEATSFPKGVHDDMLDAVMIAIDQEFDMPDYSLLLELNDDW